LTSWPTLISRHALCRKIGIVEKYTKIYVCHCPAADKKIMWKSNSLVKVT
jgi:hypothetical protein